MTKENEISKTLYDQRLEELQNKVEGIYKKVCLHVILKNSKVENILSLSLEQLKGLDKGECAEYAFMLAQHALYIQKTINTTQTYKQWLQKHQRQFIEDHDKTKVAQLIDHLEIQYSQLEYIVQRVDYLSKCMSNLGFSRRNS